MTEENKSRFEAASQEKEPGLLGEFWLMLRENRKFWMIPLILVLLGFGLLLLLGGTAAAPFIYTLF